MWSFFVFHDRSDDAFRTISACQRVFIIIAPRRTARAPSSFISHVFLLQSIQKRNEKRNFELRGLPPILSSTIVPTTPSERSQHLTTVIIIARRKNRARAHLLLSTDTSRFRVFLSRERYKKKPRRNETHTHIKRKKERVELRVFVVSARIVERCPAKSFSDFLISVCCQSISIIIARRRRPSKKKKKKKKRTLLLSLYYL